MNRSPVVIFLSDGECSFKDDILNDLARRSQTLGRALSFHTVSFGLDDSSDSLRRMAKLATAMFSGAPRDPLSPSGAEPCSYTKAITTVRQAYYLYQVITNSNTVVALSRLSWRRHSWDLPNRCRNAGEICCEDDLHDVLRIESPEKSSVWSSSVRA